MTDMSAIADGAEGAKVRAREVLSRLPAGPVMGVEVGAFTGRMSKALLARSDLALLMVDSWEGDGAAYLEPKTDWHAGLSQRVQDHYMTAAIRNTAFAGERCTIIRQRSLQVATLVEAEEADFVFLDADHSEQGCRADIAAWWPKIKPGGFISGHDYDHPDFPGVTVAVDQFVADTGLSLSLGRDATWFATRKAT